MEFAKQSDSMPKSLKCQGALSARVPWVVWVPTECLQSVQMGQSSKSLFIPINQCQKCYVNRMIFVPKLLNKNLSLMNNTSYLNIRKEYPNGGHILESKDSVRYNRKRAHLIYIFKRPIKNECFKEKLRIFH